MGYEIDFLPVGEDKSGDAIALRFGNLLGTRDEQIVVVIDGGFQETGEQLVEHMKKYYGTDHVNLVVSTHPDADHAGGLEIVLDKCKVDALWMHLPWNHTVDIAKLFVDGRVTDASVRESLRKSLDNARALERLATRKRIPIVEPFDGVIHPSGKIVVVGPTQRFYEDLLPGFRGTPEPKSPILGAIGKMFHGAEEIVTKIAENWGLETLDDDGETSAENNSSAILGVIVGDKWVLFTGDAGIPALTDVVTRLESRRADFSKLDFIQVPHHGSRRNVGPTLLDRLLGPKRGQDKKLRTAFVSAAKGGAPKHPSKKVTNAFRRRGVHVYATQGQSILHHEDAPHRGWTSIEPVPFFDEVED